MKNKNIIIILSALTALFLCNFVSAGASFGGNNAYEIRIYCEYKDKAGKNTTFKLLNKDKTTVKVASTFIRHIDNVRYTVSEPRFSELIKSCKSEIGDRGELTRLRGTNAGNYESLTFYYDVKAP